jgi:hypothetical protein
MLLLLLQQLQHNVDEMVIAIVGLPPLLSSSKEDTKS